MAPNIKSFRPIVPMIYAYTLPGIPYKEGWTKVGYTEKQTVEDRINQQTHTAHVHWKLAWKDNAIYKDGSGEKFTDHDFHAYLERELVERDPNTEWFHETGPELLTRFMTFASREIPVSKEELDYTLRQEQADAVKMTKEYFANGGTEFLWNAKPRFGKTLTAYDLIRQMGFTKVLIVTNRPSIANSWAEDFHKFIGWRKEYAFISENDALKGKPGVLSRGEYLDYYMEEIPGMIVFESLQGLKGSVYFGGKFDKLEWLAKSYTDREGFRRKGVEFDLLIVDESQEGIDTIRTDRAFRNIQRKHTLYLSGTPFKALASDQFAENQIFNWSYADEQEAKENWAKEEFNPYERLPRMEMYTYQISNMIYDQVQRGIDLSDDETVDYAFDLNEFFATKESGKFEHEEEIKKFLHALVTNEKYPYSTPELRQELKHTLWLLNRVASAKALAELLKADPVFSEYEIVLAAGDGRLDDGGSAGAWENEKSFDRVKAAIASNEKTITLSVGQLTVGVTIPEWSGVLMLCNLQSPSSYMQAAFRAQNPCTISDGGHYYRKETAYVFDFDPARTLTIFDEFANNLSPRTAEGRGTADDRKENIKRLLNFFPVLGEDDEGRMVELDAAQVLSIPRKLKSQEVVRHGFISNFLFRNISNVFGAPGVVRDIVEKLSPANEDPKKRDKDNLNHISDVTVDENGNVEVPNEIVIGKAQDVFGEKKYEDIMSGFEPQISELAKSEHVSAAKNTMRNLADSVKAKVKEEYVKPAADAYDVRKGTLNRIERQVDQEIDRKFEEATGDYLQRVNIAQVEFEKKQQVAESEEELNRFEIDLQAQIRKATLDLSSAAESIVQEETKNRPTELVERLEKNKAEEEKKSVEDSIRAHLRGFARTIPSFIMAYGDENLTLRNFDDYTEDDVFEEVTGITEADFRFLRDGGEYINPDTGLEEYFAGQLFDETVFNDSIVEFLRKKQELANYFDESHEEDIFDYIPPQKTNQIFTPRWVVRKMVNQLEENNPGCFDDSSKTFADLYMKSGLYITEIVKRLFRSEVIKAEIPDDGERIRHILRNQVYGMAPTRIIYLIATNYILGFDEDLKRETANFVQADAAQAAKDGTLDELVERCFG